MDGIGAGIVSSFGRICPRRRRTLLPTEGVVRRAGGDGTGGPAPASRLADEVKDAVPSQPPNHTATP